MGAHSGQEDDPSHIGTEIDEHECALSLFIILSKCKLICLQPLRNQWTFSSIFNVVFLVDRNRAKVTWKCWAHTRSLKNLRALGFGQLNYGQRPCMGFSSPIVQSFAECAIFRRGLVLQYFTAFTSKWVWKTNSIGIRNEKRTMSRIVFELTKSIVHFLKDPFCSRESWLSHVLRSWFRLLYEASTMLSSYVEYNGHVFYTLFCAYAMCGMALCALPNVATDIGGA